MVIGNYSNDLYCQNCGASFGDHDYPLYGVLRCSTCHDTNVVIHMKAADKHAIFHQLKFEDFKVYTRTVLEYCYNPVLE